MYEDLIGTVQGRWTILSCERKQKSGKKRAVFSCECSCGVLREVDGDSIKDGRSLSCGCLRRDLLTKHGYSYTKEARIYYGMLQRCYNENRDDYKAYGARGIRVSEDWKQGLENFIRDMGKMPDSNCTLERKDFNKDYCKENCIWTSNLGLQSFNTRRRKTNTSGRTGVFYSKNLWMASIGVNGKTIYLGGFETKEAAIKIRSEAEMKYYGFTKE